MEGPREVCRWKLIKEFRLVLEELIEEIDGARYVGSDDALMRGNSRVSRRSSLWSAVLIFWKPFQNALPVKPETSTTQSPTEK